VHLGHYHDCDGEPMSGAYMPISKTDDWATPADLWQKLNQMHAFDVDAAASQSNHLCDRWYGLDHDDINRRDGLNAQWDGQMVWINPPYGRVIADWAKAAQLHASGGGQSSCCCQAELIHAGFMIIAFQMMWNS